MNDLDYWKEGISKAAEECGLAMTAEQLECIAYAVAGGHENYWQAFYSPPWHDRMAVMQRECDERVKQRQAELDKYRDRAETALRQALRLYPDTKISIHEGGEVLRHGGRTERIQ